VRIGRLEKVTNFDIRGNVGHESVAIMRIESSKITIPKDGLEGWLYGYGRVDW
jgi:hypothetical protein